MQKKAAALRIKETVELIRSVSGMDVFDEWALVALCGSDWKVLFYQSPRAEEFKRKFREDVSSIDIQDLKSMQIGELGFSEKGYGTKFDAYLCVGEGLFALFNETHKIAREITESPSWKIAQKQFERLEEKFILDPVCL